MLRKLLSNLRLSNVDLRGSEPTLVSVDNDYQRSISLIGGVNGQGATLADVNRAGVLSVGGLDLTKYSSIKHGAITVSGNTIPFSGGVFNRICGVVYGTYGTLVFKDSNGTEIASYIPIPVPYFTGTTLGYLVWFDLVVTANRLTVTAATGSFSSGIYSAFQI